MNSTLTSLIEPLGWALLHFLWQAAVIALLLRVFLRLARHRSPQTRYAAAGAAMLLMLGAATATVWWQARGVRADGKDENHGIRMTGAADISHSSASSHSSHLPAGPLLSPPLPASGPADAEHVPAPVPVPAPSSPGAALTAAAGLRPLLPWMVGIWAAGVAFFSLRLLNGWRMTRQLRASGSDDFADDWRQLFFRLCQRLRLTRPVRLLSSASLAVPVVIGWLKPVVLVPAGLFSGLGSAQLEALLAHELAHVRRHDYLVNLLQNALETLFFYHPAVWWASAQLRKEREHCCDDVATSLSGGVLHYARALTALEEMRRAPGILTISASGGSLLQRIRRLAGKTEDRPSGMALPLGLVTFCAAAIALPFTLLSAGQTTPFTAPQAAHVGNEKHSAYCVHDGKETHFVLVSGVPFTSETTSGANPKLKTWHDDGTLKFDNGCRLIFSRESASPGSLKLISSGKDGGLVANSYDLTKGRVFLIDEDAVPKQLTRKASPVTTREALDALYHDIAVDAQDPASSAPVIRGFRLASVTSTTDAVHITDLYEPDPQHPGMFAQKFGVFEMPIYGAEGEPWLKYPAGRGAFYIEFKDRTFGPIPGDPMEKLKLTELLREKLREEHANDALLRLRKMIIRGDDALRSTAYSLMQELAGPKWRFDYDELIKETEEALKKAPAAPSAAAGAAALAHVKALADAAKAAWEKSRVTLPDSDYQLAENAGDDEGIIWSEPDATGMSMGIAGLKDGAAWTPGGQIEFTLWIRNDSKEPVKFTWTPRLDEGLRMWVTDEKGQRRDAEIVMNTSLLVPNRTRLEPGQKLELKEVTLNIVAPNSDGTPPARGPDEGWHPRLVLPDGTSNFIVEARIGSFESKDGEGKVTVPAAGEWTGTLLAPEILVHCAKPTAGERDQTPSDLYLKAYLQLLEADKLSRNGRIEEALKSYKSVMRAFDQIAKDHPKWNPEIVDYRRRKTAEIVAGLEKKQREDGKVEPPAARSGSGNPVAAIVNGRPVLKSEVEAQMKSSDLELRSRITDQVELDAEMKKLRSKALNALIDQELILKEFEPFAAAFGLKVEAETEERINKRFVEGLFKGDRQKFLEELDRTGIGYNNFREQQKKNLIVEMMRGQFAKVDSPQVTAEEKAAWLKAYGDIFRTGGKLKLRSLTIPGTAEGKTPEQQRALADEVRTSLVNGADFAAQARTHSTDSKRDAGGSWDWVEEKDLSSAFWSIVSALETGKISEIVSLQGSFYIFLVEDREAGKTKPQAEIDLEVERRIQMERRQKASEAWLKKLREKAAIEIMGTVAGDSERVSLWDEERESLEPERKLGAPRISGVFDVPRPVVALSRPDLVSLPDLSGLVAAPDTGSFADAPVVKYGGALSHLNPAPPSKHEETNSLLKLWREEYNGQEKLPAEAMLRLAEKVKEYIERYPGEPAEKMKRQLIELELRVPWKWESAQTMLDAICDSATAPVGWLELDEQFRSFNRVKPGQKWTEEQLAKLPFGETHASGLRATWIFNPMQDTYAAGRVLKCRILIHNNGKETAAFRTDQWHQDDQWIVKNAAGEEIKVKTTWYSGITPWQKVRLEPGQVYEVAGHGVGIGDANYKESYSIGAIGAEIPAKPGDELTCQWIVKLDPSGRKDPNWTPPPGSPPPSLTTGTVKFKVTAADPEAAPKVGVARGTGKYDLAEGMKLQVTQTTSSKEGEPAQRRNTATIEWYAGNGQLGISWPVELMPGLKIDTIVWKRGGTALWIVHEKAVRKIDFTNAADVKEQNWKWESAGDFGGAPQEVRAEIEKSRPKIAQVPLPSAILQFRLAAGREEPDTEPMEPVENWSDLPTFHLRKTPILTAANVESVSTESDKEPGKWQIKLLFTEEGGATLAKETKKHPGRQLAIVGNGSVISAPVMQGEIGKQVILSGNYLESEAKELVNAIRAAASAARTADDPLTKSKMMTITVDDESHLLLDGALVTLQELEQKLKTHKAANPDFPVIIRGDTASAYQTVMDVIDLLGRLGITQVGMATKKEPAAAAKSEAELNLMMPAARDEGVRNDDELIINVAGDGSITQAGEDLTLEALKAKLTETAKAGKMRPVIIRGEEAVKYGVIVKVLGTCHEAGMHQVSFATLKSPEEVRKSAAEKLLEEGASLSSAGKFDEARKTLEAVQSLLGKPGDAGFPAENVFLLADAEFAFGRLDALQASQPRTESAEGKRITSRLIESAITRFTDGLKRLLDYDKENKKSLSSRRRLAFGYHELGRLLDRKGSQRDASVAYGEAIKVYTELIKEEPNNATHNVGLAKCYNEVAQLIRTTKPGPEAAAEALEYQNFSVTALRGLYEKEPGNSSVGSLFASSLLLNGELRQSSGDAATAHARFQEASTITTALLGEKGLSKESLKELESIAARVKAKAMETAPAPATDPAGSDSSPNQLKIGLVDLKRLFQEDHNTNDAGKEGMGDKAKAREKLDQLSTAYQKLVGEWETASKIVQEKLAPAELKEQKQAEIRRLTNEIKALEREIDEIRRQREQQLQKKVKDPSGDEKSDDAAPSKSAPHIIQHDDGTRTEVIQKGKSEIQESTFNKDGVLTERRIFINDSRGRPRRGIIYDGNQKPLGSIEFGYAKGKDDPVEERHFNVKGKLIRRIFYPGTLKEEKYAGRFVAFEYNPDKPREKPVEAADSVKRTHFFPTTREKPVEVIEGVKPTRFFSRALDEPVIPPKPVKVEPDPFSVPSDPEKFAEARRTGIMVNVLDTTGQKPIAEFRVIAGVKSGAGGEKDKNVANWQPHTLHTGTRGGLIWPLDKAYDEMALRVEADGYEPQVFVWIKKSEGAKDLYFQLAESNGTAGRVLTLDGKPAAEATVALAMVQRDAVIENGTLRHLDAPAPEKPSDRWRWPRFVKADADGRFQLPPEYDPTAAVLIVHDSGVREMSLEDFKKAPDVTLQPWSRIEGKVQWGEKAGTDQKVSLTIHRDDYGYPGVIAQDERTVSGKDGKFVFEKVLPGRVQISCPIAAEAGNKRGITEINLTGRIAHATVQSGNNTVIIGGSGRTVKGKLTGRDDWKDVTFHFHPTAPHIGFPGDDEMWKAWSAFQKSPEGAAYFRSGLKVQADGTFEIPGVLPGHYQIFFSREGEKGHIAGGKFSVEAEKPGERPDALALPDMKATPAADHATEPDK